MALLVWQLVVFITKVSGLQNTRQQFTKIVIKPGVNVWAIRHFPGNNKTDYNNYQYQYYKPRQTRCKQQQRPSQQMPAVEAMCIQSRPSAVRARIRRSCVLTLSPRCCRTGLSTERRWSHNIDNRAQFTPQTQLITDCNTQTLATV